MAMAKWQFLVVAGGLAAPQCFASTLAAAQQAPFDLNSKAAISAGQEVFAATCTYCHGDQGSGGRAGPLRGREDFTAEYVFGTITHGKRVGAFNMPAWGDSGTLDEKTRWQLTAYILSLRTAK